ncbi:uncharacterized protein PHALS_09697 [Plasmopara halstedii]|uniref:Uncharacterized protein n=1 Tax=Plasmopara halstedii TaxID=4781 RepID=A0A0N7L4S0_PLAHL|nr:uncharacterized protein PHALS_09697 [Plasmopara halstedii]CEG39451.1 hypothetical protein PHALS_09697 [Plasmopara halstedii]|eukprot:XP_024575820.1 hypothetical protein PHALS_09697 [Plasmopara halstedii]
MHNDQPTEVESRTRTTSTYAERNLLEDKIFSGDQQHEPIQGVEKDKISTNANQIDPDLIADRRLGVKDRLQGGVRQRVVKEVTQHVGTRCASSTKPQKFVP